MWVEAKQGGINAKKLTRCKVSQKGHLRPGGIQRPRGRTFEGDRSSGCLPVIFSIVHTKSAGRGRGVCEKFRCPKKKRGREGRGEPLLRETERIQGKEH